MNRIWWREDLPTMEKFVALAIADWADNEGLANPAVETLSEKCSCSERTVQKAIKSLCDRGLMRKVQRRDMSNIYCFVMDNLPIMERKKRRKESRFSQQMTGERRSPVVDLTTGERGSLTGESGSLTGERGAPYTTGDTTRDTSEDSSGDFEGEITVASVEDDLFAGRPDSNPQMAAADQKPEPCLCEHIEARWKELKAKHPGIAAVRKIDEGLKHTIELRARSHAQTGQTAIDVWNEALDAVDRSEFLTGRVPPGKGRDAPFKLTLGWLAKSANFREVIGGKYDAKRDPQLCDPDTGRRLGPTEQALARSLAKLRAGQERRFGQRGPGDDVRRLEHRTG